MGIITSCMGLSSTPTHTMGLSSAQHTHNMDQVFQHTQHRLVSDDRSPIKPVTYILLCCV